MDMKNIANDSEISFFARLPPLRSESDTFDPAQYGAAPNDWLLVGTDIENSTDSIAKGGHKEVNFVAAASIAALKNLCFPVSIPFLFGGDGSFVMVPGERAAETRIALARLRGLAAREFKLALRVGLIAVEDIRRFGSDVLVGRYEPSPGNSFGVFRGGGVGLLDGALKSGVKSELASLAAISDSLDDGGVLDLSGLSCRWNDLRSTRGKMVTLIIHGAADSAEVYAAVMGFAAQFGDSRPVRPDTLTTRWPPKDFMVEAHARRGHRPLAFAAAQVLMEALFSHLLFARGRPFFGFDPLRYRDEIATNTDFCKHDDTVNFVIDCPVEGISAIRGYLDERAARNELRYGMHLSETALMTCLVSSAPQGRHIHFIDGGLGGYTAAAQVLKRSTEGREG
jgi:Protein of unknown function (DUF3095)